MIKLNSIYEDKDRATELISESEEAFDLSIREIAEDICRRKDVRCLTLAGPTCSGKTTTAAKLTAALEKEGRRARVVSIDDFYYDEREMAERGVTDFEGPDAMNIPLLARAAGDLAAGKSTLMPTFDFTDRTRAAFTEYIPTSGDIYIFEGIQAIYPEIVSVLKAFRTKSIFINVAKGVSVCGTAFERSEIRLIRRIVRDAGHRNTPPHLTMKLWQAVRRNEEENIFPFAGREDYIINSLLPYEVLLMSRLFLNVTRGYPLGGTGTETVYSLRERLEKLSHTAVSAELVPMSSVIREFAD
ncbi:MAG: hypothetical protein PUC29_06375 [Clostridia bacterium]|nr:hypothetical protein [Clostridia bacterium]